VASGKSTQRQDRLDIAVVDWCSIADLVPAFPDSRLHLIGAVVASSPDWSLSRHTSRELRSKAIAGRSFFTLARHLLVR
jgi:hypothetical protein